MTEANLSNHVLKKNSVAIPDSPCLQNVPEIPSPKNAILGLKQFGKPESSDASSQMNDVANLAHIFLPTVEHARILIEVIGQVRESYMNRNLCNDGYRNYTMTAHEFLHRAFDRHGIRMNLAAGKAPGAVPRGIFVCAQARMGRHRLAGAIESFLGTGVHKVRVPIFDKFMDFLQLKTLRVNWPEDGKKKSLVKAFVSAFDAAMDTSYSTICNGPLAGDKENVLAMSALGTACNLGLLVVERINCGPANCKSASETWDALGIFTRTTGIPVLCLATPGAAVGLSKQEGSIGDLVPNGLHRISIPMPNSPAWKSSCNLFFQSSLKGLGIEEIPDWFSQTLWDLSRGRYGIATKACSIVTRNFHALEKLEITEKIFIEVALKGLALDMPHINADKVASLGGTFRTHSQKRHGDWLPLEMMLTTMPTLEFVEAPLQVS